LYINIKGLGLVKVLGMSDEGSGKNNAMLGMHQWGPNPHNWFHKVVNGKKQPKLEIL
jgi:hypothetical protein